MEVLANTLLVCLGFSAFPPTRAAEIRHGAGGRRPTRGVTTFIEEMPDQVGHDGDYLERCPIKSGMTVGFGWA